MQRELPSFDQVPRLAKKRVKPFDPTYAGETKARIAHMCDFCGEVIAPGEIYYLEHKNRFPIRSWRRGRKCCRDCHAVEEFGRSR